MFSYFTHRQEAIHFVESVDRKGRGIPASRREASTMRFLKLRMNRLGRRIQKSITRESWQHHLASDHITRA